MEDLSNYSKREKTSIIDRSKELSGSVEKLNSVITNGEAIVEAIKSQKGRVDDEIVKFFADLSISLEKTKADLLRQCSEIATTKITAQSIQLEELVSLKEAIVACTQYVSNSRECYSESEILSAVPTLHSRISELNRKIEQTSLTLTETGTIQFVVGADISNIVSGFKISSIKSRDYSTLHDPAMSPVKTSNAYHITLHSNGDMIVADHGGNRVQVYSSTGIMKSSFGSYGHQQGQFNHPLGVTVVGDCMLLNIRETGVRRCL